MKAGERVRLIGIPPDLNEDAELQTKTLFEKCLGKSFSVDEMETVAGLPQQLAKLDVGHVLGEASYCHTIWVEEEYLQIEENSQSSGCMPEPICLLIRNPTISCCYPRPSRRLGGVAALRRTMDSIRELGVKRLRSAGFRGTAEGSSG